MPASKQLLLTLKTLKWVENYGSHFGYAKAEMKSGLDTSYYLQKFMGLWVVVIKWEIENIIRLGFGYSFQRSCRLLLASMVCITKH